MHNYRQNKSKITLTEDQNIWPGIMFLAGQCQYCGFYPKYNYIKQSDQLYHCSRCGYPMEFHALMELMIRFEKEMESDAHLSDSMIQQKNNVIK